MNRPEWMLSPHPGDRLMVLFRDSGAPEPAMVVEDDWRGDAHYVDYWSLLCRCERTGVDWWVTPGDMISLISKADGSPVADGDGEHPRGPSWDFAPADWRLDLNPGDRITWALDRGPCRATVEDWERVDVTGYPLSIVVRLDDGRQSGSYFPADVLELISKADRSVVDG
jgi:hypothetical protein